MKDLILLAIGAYVLYKYAPIGEVGAVIPFSALADAIQQEEGYYPGSRSYRNNNPGNLRYVGQAGTTGADSEGFAVFASYQAGYNALVAQLQLDAARNPSWTLSDLINSYAPPSENDTNSYISNISSILQSQGYQVSSSTGLGEFA